MGRACSLVLRRLLIRSRGEEGGGEEDRSRFAESSIIEAASEEGKKRSRRGREGGEGEGGISKFEGFLG